MGGMLAQGPLPQRPRRLTGGTEGGVHVTDVTNASRTRLMHLKTLAWDASMAADMTILVRIANLNNHPIVHTPQTPTTSCWNQSTVPEAVS